MLRKKTALATFLAPLGATALTVAMAAGALGYAGEVPLNITVTTSGTIAANTPIPVSATVLGASGTGVPGVTVTFAITSSPAGASDVLSSTTAVTDANGIATVNLTLSAVAGTRVVTATAEGGVLGSVSITLLPGSLPNTSTSVPTAPVNPLPVGIMLISSAAAILGLWHIRRSREKHS